MGILRKMGLKSETTVERAARKEREAFAAAFEADCLRAGLSTWEVKDAARRLCKAEEDLAKARKRMAQVTTRR